MIPSLNLEPIEKIEKQKTKNTACFPFFGRKVESGKVTKRNQLTPRPQVYKDDIDLSKTINFIDLKTNPGNVSSPNWQTMPLK